MPFYRKVIRDMIFTRKTALFLVFVFSVSFALAQNKYSRSADEAFSDQMYNLALTRYQKAYSKVKGNKVEKDRISLRIADCYRMMNNMKRAEISYKRLISNKYVKKDPRIYLYYADASKTNGKYEQAIENYKLYKEEVPNDSVADMGIESCKMAMEWMENPTKYEVTLEKKINSRDDDFGASYADKTLRSILFTSDRAASNGKEMDNWTGLEFSDLFLARRDANGNWSNPIPADLSGSLNTKANEGAGQFNSRFTTLYFTRCWNDLKKKNGCAIFRVSRTGATAWGEPELLSFGDSTRAIGQPTVTSDESTIYFSADLPGGYGGKDIWVATKKSKGRAGGFGKPENLGPDINTPGDELFPTIREDSILYFASNGYPGMGGLDIFRSVKDGIKWSKPENMKYPINSFADDFAIVFSPDDEEAGFFCSNRPGGKGRDDIYSFIVPPLLFTLQGTITDDRTLQPLPGAKVRILGSNGKSMEYTSDDKGNYSFNKNQILPNVTYDILVTKKDYFNEKGKETTVGLEKSRDLTRNFVLKPIPKKPVVLPDILYDLAKWDLKPQFQDSLQGLIETLDANENLVIELASHTDSRDTEERNDILSQKRAQSVVDYLVSRGIDPDRLVAKGYGERVPRTLTKDITKDGYFFKAGTVLTDSLINTLPNTQAKEAAHALNRRTEFSILRNDFIPKPKPGKVSATKIEVVVNPEEEEDVPFTMTKEDLPEATCYVNGITETFLYDNTEKDFFISPATAFGLLKEGVISKDDFEGDASKFILEGTIADKAVITLKEIRIGKRTANNLKATVNVRLRGNMLFGANTLSLFGKFTINTKESKIVFEP